MDFVQALCHTVLGLVDEVRDVGTDARFEVDRPLVRRFHLGLSRVIRFLDGALGIVFRFGSDGSRFFVRFRDHRLSLVLGFRQHGIDFRLGLRHEGRGGFLGVCRQFGRGFFCLRQILLGFRVKGGRRGLRFLDDGLAGDESVGLSTGFFEDLLRAGMGVLQFLLRALAGLFGQLFDAHFGSGQIFAASGFRIVHDLLRFRVGAVDDLAPFGRKDLRLFDLFRDVQTHIFDNGLDGVRIDAGFSGERAPSPAFKEFFDLVEIIFDLCHVGYSFLKRFLISSPTASGTKSEMSPPSWPICLTRLELRNM